LLQGAINIFYSDFYYLQRFWRKSCKIATESELRNFCPDAWLAGFKVETKMVAHATKFVEVQPIFLSANAFSYMVLTKFFALLPKSAFCKLKF
jgi:hypothetical protein